MPKILKNRFVKMTLRFLFSHLGLCILVSVYAVCGGFLIRSFEVDYEMNLTTLANESAQIIGNYTDMLRTQIHKFNEMCNTKTNGTHELKVLRPNCSHGQLVFETWIAEWQRQIFYERSTTDGAYTGLVEYDLELTKWTIPSSIMFTASILTTIGYGHIWPNTQTGQLVVILYSLLAIPLMSIFLINYGTLFGDLLSYVYQRGCCGPLNKTRSKTHVTCKPNNGGGDDFDRTTISTTDDNQSQNMSDTAAIVPKSADDEDEQRKHVDKMIDDKAIDVDGVYEMPKHVPATLTVAAVTLVALFGTIFFAWSEGWTLVESFYFTFVTLATIGFGDFVPGWRNGQQISAWRLIFLSMYAVVALAVSAMMINVVMQSMMDYASKWSAALKRQVNLLKDKAAKSV